ncbi:MAG TPA: hypothetical protein VGV59_09715 [Pyrinomonadaceae bacterium]|nr:hypothetical protein [Pyrinomonadaceae bacterium]
MSEADAESAREFKEGAGAGALWAGLVVAPLTTLVQQTTSYALVHQACRTGQEWSLHVASVVALLLVCGCALLSWRSWRRAGAGAETEGAGVLPRSRFMAVVGLLISALSALVVIAQWIAVFVYAPCQR